MTQRRDTMSYIDGYIIPVATADKGRTGATGAWLGRYM